MKKAIEFDLECTLSMYKGESVFSMQLNSPDLFSVLEKPFVDTVYEDEVDEDDNLIENL